MFKTFIKRGVLPPLERQNDDKEAMFRRCFALLELYSLPNTALSYDEATQTATIDASEYYNKRSVKATAGSGARPWSK